MSKRPVQLDARRPIARRDPAMEVHLLGRLGFDECLALQQRLVYESGGRADGQIDLLLCEHPPIITIGRAGSRADLLAGAGELDSRRLAVRWVNRGGGGLVHAPGQLAVYPIVPLAWHRFSVGEYLGRLQTALHDALAELKVAAHQRRGRVGLWGRSGQLAVVGAAVKDWTSYFGAYVNVAPSMSLMRLVATDSREQTPISSLAIERRQRVKMTSLREGLLRHLASALGCERYHIHTGHPLLGPAQRVRHEPIARVG